MGLRHSFTCSYQGQAFSWVKKWFEVQISGILPEIFSYILTSFVYIISIILAGRLAALVLLAFYFQI